LPHGHLNIAHDRGTGHINVASDAKEISPAALLQKKTNELSFLAKVTFAAAAAWLLQSAGGGKNFSEIREISRGFP
jgi:hypothetical protein